MGFRYKFSCAGWTSLMDSIAWGSLTINSVMLPFSISMLYLQQGPMGYDGDSPC
jgi:hypothetical protein